MAHYYRQDAVHRAPQAARYEAPPYRSGREHAAQEHAAREDTARIDCDTCPIAGRGCGGCMVALLGPVRLRLDELEQRAVGRLVRAGLVGPQDGQDAYAEPDLPDWVTATWPETPEHAERLRAIG